MWAFCSVFMYTVFLLQYKVNYKVNVSAFGCAKNACVHFRISSDFSTEVHRKGHSFPTVRFRLILTLRSSCVVFLCVWRCSDSFPSFLSLRKTFGWKSLAINLVGYLLFVFPLTGFAVYSRANERVLCDVNETIPRKVTTFVVFSCCCFFLCVCGC